MLSNSNQRVNGSAQLIGLKEVAGRATGGMAVCEGSWAGDGLLALGLIGGGQGTAGDLVG